jgi:hypothetical protein
MTTPARKTLWQRLRLCFRWCRIFLWLLLLGVVGAFIYLNRVGLPDIVKNRVLAELRDRGVDVEFKRLRLRWYQGFVAEQINVGRAGLTRGPQLTIDEAVLRLDGEALRKFQIKLTGVMVRDGRLIWPLLVSNQPNSELKLEKISTELRFLPGDLWELDHFQANSFGIQLNASGAVTNATRMRDHFRRKKRGEGTEEGPRDTEAGLRRFVAVMEQLHFTAPPEIDVSFGGDASVTNRFTAQLKCKAGGATTPWGAWQNFLLDLQLQQDGTNQLAPTAILNLEIEAAQTQWVTGRVARVSAQVRPATNGPTAMQADWSLSLGEAVTRWGNGSNLQFTGESVRPATNSAWLQTTFTLQSGLLHTEWFDSSSNHVTGRLEHFFTNPVPMAADCKIQMVKPTTRWGRADTIALDLKSVQDTNFVRQADAPAGWWTPIEPFALDWKCRVQGLDTPKLALEDFSCAGQWRAPQVSLRDITAKLYGGGLKFDAQLDVPSRRVEAQGGFDFDVQNIKPLLNTNGQKWISQFSWRKAPTVTARAGVTLPSWTNAPADFKGVLPSLFLAGHVECGPGAYREIDFDSAHTDFKLSNSVWHLPNLTAHRPEGDAVLDYLSHAVTLDYHWGIRSHIDPNIIKPFFETEKERKIFDYFVLTGPPVVEGDIWGRWHAREQTGFDIRLAITNFIARGEGCSNFSARVQFTNNVMDITDLRIGRGEQLLAGGPAQIDFTTMRLKYTNVHSTLDPIAAMNTIGPRTVDAIKAYQFAVPPTVETYGSINLKEIETTDLHFLITGGPFNYWKFNMTTITGAVHWVTNKLYLENVEGPFYGGTIKGDAEFDFAPVHGSQFNFHALATDANLHFLIADIANPTNKLEGVFTTDLHITSAMSTNWDSWQGHGNVKMRDGLLWEAPIFGIFSPLLNGVSPGLGNTKASEARATYRITNSVIRTADMEIHSAPVRLRYTGTVDFNARVNAHVEADIWREAPLIGQLLRIFTKVWEYKVTGTLSQPRSEPVFFIPRLIKFPFSPFKSIKDLLTPDPDKPEKVKPADKNAEKPPAKPPESPPDKP